MLKYKPKDRVIIKLWSVMQKQYGGDEFAVMVPQCFTDAMEKELAGNRVVTLLKSRCPSMYYYIKAKSQYQSNWAISDEMILGYAFGGKEEIEASNDKKKWIKAEFSHYASFDKNPKIGVIGGKQYSYARPIKK